MIIVTGASGRLGQRILSCLLQKLPAAQLAATTRDPARLTALTQQGVQLRRADFAEPDTLRAAFEGATQLLLVSSNAAARGQDSVAQHRAAITAARAAGVQRIVYTSHMGASATSAFPPMKTHAATEQLLQESGMAWTALRNGFYASTLTMIGGDAANTGVLAAPHDGPVAWTAHDDLAAAAAAILVDAPGRFNGPTPPLTAAAALDLAQIAALLSVLHGRPVQHRPVPDDEHARRLAERGLPPAVIDITMGMYRAARQREFAAVDPTLATLIGRAPIPAVDVLAAPAA